MLAFIFYYIFMPLLILGVIVFVHELGHFLMARFYGFATPVFSVGFGREIIGRTDKHGTRWKLAIFPFGGYVSLGNQDAQPLYQRALVAAAGPMANMIFAILVMVALTAMMGVPKTPSTIVAVNTKGGAFEAGMLPLDNILTLDGVSIPENMERIKEIIQESKAPVMIAKIERQNQQMTLQIPIRAMKETGDFGEDTHRKMLGVLFPGQNLKITAINRVGDVVTEGQPDQARAELIKYLGKNVVINFGKGPNREDFLVRVDKDLNKGLLDENSKQYSSLVLWDNSKMEFMPVSLWSGVGDAFQLVYDGCKKTLGVLYQIIVGKKSVGDMGGVVSISTMTAETTEQSNSIGPYYIIKWMAVLSIGIGFINILPFPMLDGGHLAFHAYEAVRRKPPTLKAKGYIYGFGIVFIIALSLFVNYHDLIERLNG